MFHNPYAQVALTYLRRPFSSWKSGVVFVLAILLAVPSAFALGRVGNHQRFALQELFPFLLVFLGLIAHAKDQFADSRAHLTPRFRRPHAIVATAAAVFFAVCLPATVAWLFDRHSIGFVAMAVLLFNSVLWILLSMSGWLSWLVLLGWFSLCTDVGQEFSQQLVTGKMEWLAATILAIGAAATVLGGIRLFRLNEDMPEYRWIKWNKLGTWDQTVGLQSLDEPITRGLRNWVIERQMARLARHARQASRSSWSRICRWQAGMVARWSLLFWCVGLVVYVHVLTSWVLSDKPAGWIGLVCFCLTYIPPFMVLGAVASRRSAFGRESLMPVDRRTYVRQLGLAALASDLGMWTAMSVSLFLWLILVSSQPVQFTMLAGALAISGAFQMVALGIMVWMARYRERWLIFLPIMLIVPISQFAILGWTRSSDAGSFGELLCICGGAVVVGLLITWDAYRRWLVVDFD